MSVAAVVGGTGFLGRHVVAALEQAGYSVRVLSRRTGHFGFEVKNLPAVLAELRSKGVKMAFEMRDTPTEAFAFISDNAGNAIELIEHKTAR